MLVYLDGTPEQVLEKLFRLFDVNEDGTISRPEMLVSSFTVWTRSICADLEPVLSHTEQSEVIFYDIRLIQGLLFSQLIPFEIAEN